MPKMIYLSQRDPSWSEVKLGESTLTLGRFGCTTTCIAMLSSYFDCFRSPPEIAHNVHIYTKDGLVLWSTLSFQKMVFLRRVKSREDKVIKEYLKDPTKAVMLNVNNGAHWVVALKPTLLSNSYICVDPWTGKQCDVIKSYHDITGAAYFARS